MRSPNSNSTSGFLVHLQGEIGGPFDLGLIEAMVMSGVYPPDVKIQKEGESGVFPLSKWTKSVPVQLSSGTGTPPSKVAMGRSTPHVTESPTVQIDRTSRTASASGQDSNSAAVTVAWIVGLFFALFLIGLVSAPTRHRTSTKLPEDPAVSATQRDRPKTIRTPSPKNKSSTPTVSYQLPPVAPPRPVYTQDASSTLYRDAQGNTYRVPQLAYHRLLVKKSEIESAATELKQLESEVEQLSSQLDRDRIYLDRSSQYQVDSYNAKVDRLNQLNEEAQPKVRSHNAKVAEFNAELERVGTLIR